MNTHDINDREYARISQLKVGDKVEVDHGFTCIKGGSVVEVKKNSGAGKLYFECNEGKHFLDGQADDREHLIGLYKVD